MVDCYYCFIKLTSVGQVFLNIGVKVLKKKINSWFYYAISQLNLIHLPSLANRSQERYFFVSKSI